MTLMEVITETAAETKIHIFPEDQTVLDSLKDPFMRMDIYQCYLHSSLSDRIYF